MNLSYQIGRTYFELSNHLGNVLTVVTDRKFAVDDGGGGISYYTPDVVSASDYYPFGMQMSERSVSSGAYRYGFNGKEKDTEGMGGGGSTYDYGFRIYNPQIAKFLSVDPLFQSFPWYTTYQFAGNKPIIAIDLDGLEEYIVVNIYSKTETDEQGNPQYLRTETKKLDKVGDLGYGRLHLYMFEDGTAAGSSLRFTYTAYDVINNLWNGIFQPNIKNSLSVLSKILQQETGILVFGKSGDGGKDSPGSKTKGFFATFDFAAFDEIMGLVVQSVGSKKDNELSADDIESISKSILEKHIDLKEIKEAEKKKKEKASKTNPTARETWIEVIDNKNYDSTKVWHHIDGGKDLTDTTNWKNGYQNGKYDNPQKSNKEKLEEYKNQKTK